MISRRNIRIKVMQVLYQEHTGRDNIKDSNAVKILDSRLQQTTNIFVYLVYFLTEVARYAEKDASLRAAKNLVTESDRNVNIKLAGNQNLWKILENNSFKIATKNTFEFDDTAEYVRKAYQQLAKSETYHAYIATQSRDKNAEKDILVFILNDIMFANEVFNTHIEEHFTNWDDDAEMLLTILPSYITKPQSVNLSDIIGAEKTKFAKDLLITVMNKGEYLEQLITPRLKNWDADRIAALDMILMQMGVAEFLYFETIPPKVTINEYIDIAKEYSTAQSGQFVNGILDGVHKDLVEGNKIHKTDYRTKKS